MYFLYVCFLSDSILQTTFDTQIKLLKGKYIKMSFEIKN